MVQETEQVEINKIYNEHKLKKDLTHYNQKKI